jgi:hypothetical protein
MREVQVYTTSGADCYVPAKPNRTDCMVPMAAIDASSTE